MVRFQEAERFLDTVLGGPTLLQGASSSPLDGLSVFSLVRASSP